MTRIPELLDNIKTEYENLAHEASLYKAQRDDYERKLQQQLTEVQNIQATLFELERNHNKIKQQYEEEIIRLRRQTAELQSNPAAASAFHGANGNQQLPGMLNGAGAGNMPGIFNTFNQVNPVAMPSIISTIDKNRPGSSFSSAAPAVTTPPAPLITGAKRGRDEPVASANAPPPPSASGPGSAFYGSPGALPSLNFTPEIQSLKQQKLEKPADSSFSLPMFKEGAPRPSPVAEPVHTSDKALPKQNPTESKRSNEDDWSVVYNPNVQTSFNVDLGSTLDHSSVVCCVRFSQDGRYLATGCNRSAQIYDAESGEKLHIFSDDNSKDGDLYIRSVCFSPDGKLLAAGAEDKTVKVWDIEHKRIAHTFVGHDLDIYSLDFTYDGKFIVSGSGDKKAKVWDVEKGKCVFTLGNEDFGPKDGVTSVAISPDGRLIAAGSLDRVVRLWDAHTGYYLDRYEGHLDSVYSVAFSPDGRSLASGSLDKTLKLWDLSGSRTRSRCRSTFTGHKDFVLSVAFSPDGNWLISGSKDRNVQFWDPRTAVTHMMLQGHKNSVISVAVNPQNGSFATGSGDYRARIWRYKPCQPVGP